jgi:hypothetical protein
MTATEQTAIEHAEARRIHCEKDAKLFLDAYEAAQGYAYNGAIVVPELEAAREGLLRLRKAAHSAAAAIEKQIEGLPGFAEYEAEALRELRA